jgi:hypothetical protein
MRGIIEKRDGIRDRDPGHSVGSRGSENPELRNQNLRNLRNLWNLRNLRKNPAERLLIA